MGILGRIGLPELLVLLAVPLFLLLAGLVFAGRIRALIIRYGEASAFRRANRLQRAFAARTAEPASIAAMFVRGLLFPRAFAAAAILSAVYASFFHWVMSTPVSLTLTAERTTLQGAIEDSAAGDWYFALKYLLYGVALVGLLRAAYLHSRPSHSRVIKYDYLLVNGAAGMLLTTTAFLGFAVTAVNPYLWQSYLVTDIALDPAVAWAMLLALNPLLWMAVLLIISKRKLRDSWLPSTQAYGAIRLLPAPILLIIGHPLVIPYLWARFIVIEAASTRPIVYLRAFRYAEGATAFGRIVFKTARAFAVVVAIVHETQRGHALMRHTSILEQPRTALLPDDVWQPWIIERLRRAFAVIVDATIETNALRWELEMARAVTGPERTCVVLRRGSVRPEAVHCVEYDLDRRSVKRARAELKQWLQSVREMKASGTSVGT